MHDNDDHDDLTSCLILEHFWLLFWSSWSTSVSQSKCREGIKFG